MLAWKKCRKCDWEGPAEKFVGRQCKKCKSIYTKKYRAKNLETIRAREKAYYYRNREDILNKYDPEKKKIVNRELYIKNRDKILQNKKEYKKNNFEKIKQYQTRYKRERYAKDVCYRLRMIFSSRIRQDIRNKRGVSYLSKLPYSIKDLKLHLESQFESWMMWNNFGSYNPKTWDDDNPNTWVWNIDHIVPHSKFQYNSMDHPDFQKCWALENLRPYSAKQNCLDGVCGTRH